MIKLNENQKNEIVFALEQLSSATAAMELAKDALHNVVVSVGMPGTKEAETNALKVRNQKDAIFSRLSETRHTQHLIAEFIYDNVDH